MMSALTAPSAQRLVAQPADAQHSVHATPLHRPFGSQRRPVHTLAAHAAPVRPLVGTVQLDPAAANFVRPDVPPLSDDEGAGRGSKTVIMPPRAFAGSKAYVPKANFRSALEQVRAPRSVLCRYPRQHVDCMSLLMTVLCSAQLLHLMHPALNTAGPQALCLLCKVSWMTSSAQAEIVDGRKSNGRLGIGMFGL